MTQIFQRCQETRDAGQKEYAHDEQNALANFERLAVDLGTSREKVLWIYTRKHLDGILASINGHQSQREGVRGRIMDVIVYLILLWAMVDDNEENAVEIHVNEMEISDDKLEQDAITLLLGNGYTIKKGK